MDEITYKLQTNASGKQILISETDRVKISVEHDDDPIESDQTIAIGEQDFKKLTVQAATHDIKFDTISRRITLMRNTHQNKRKQDKR